MGQRPEVSGRQPLGNGARGEDHDEFRQAGADAETRIANLTQQVGLERQDTDTLFLSETHLAESLIDLGSPIQLLDDHDIPGAHPVERTQGLRPTHGRRKGNP
jgi:hypothetical protein